jgi:AraC-like DNA-binding protein
MMNDSFEYSLGIGPEQHPATVDDDADRADRTAHAVLAGLRAGGDASAKGGDTRSAALPLHALRRAIQYINDNLDSRLSWGAIGAAIGLNSFRFGRDFKRATGVTPHQYVLRCRVKRAMKLLSDSDLSIADIALEIGCSCQSHFTTLFRKHTGMTPGAFRTAAEASRRRLFGTPAVAAGRRFGWVRDCGLIPRGPSASIPPSSSTELGATGTSKTSTSP